MKSIIVQAIIIILFYSCSTSTSCPSCEFTCIEEFDQDVITNACPPNYECSFLIEEGMTIDTSIYDGMKADEKYDIFHITSITEGEKLIADDEFTHEILVQVLENETSFYYEGIALQENAIARTICFCPNVDYNNTENGCVQGEKIDDIWFIQGFIDIDDFRQYKFDVAFK